MGMTHNEQIILNDTVDFITWLLPASHNFPRAHRQTVTLRLLGAALDLHEHLEAASLASGSARLILLNQAEQDLGKVRLYLRMAEKLGWLPPGEYLVAVNWLASIAHQRSAWATLTHSSSLYNGKRSGYGPDAPRLSPNPPD